MARTVDPARHEHRRLVIVDAALTVFAAHGFDGATTATICRRAGIGSGTLFHYFPTKLSILLGILEYGTREVRESAARWDGRQDSLGVLLEIVARSADEAADPRMPGFVHATAGVMHLPEVAAALEVDAGAQRACLRPWVERGQAAGEIRTDLEPARIVAWLMLFMDGYLERVALEPGFTAAGEKNLLIATAKEFLVPR
ncbi:TetR/AcrR family transcriptional regulator [Myceligenerans crystallogenes]|uniref:HTH tetR-type domain-containing protein n=1 Tax=Myceligenerans crystallogenes TaxID=316335 RepID=A0ABP4ZVH0_9MICO